MKLVSQIIFLSIFFVIYGLINYYIVRRGLTIISPNFKTAYLIVLVFFILSFILGRFLENTSIPYLPQILTWAGSFWMAFMLYFFISLLLIDELRLLNHFIHFFPSFITNNTEAAKKITGAVVVGIAVLFVTGGHINMYFPAVKKLDLSINKSAGNLKQLNIVMVSDLHLGSILGNGFLERIAEKSNELNPDIVLFVGDVVDEDIGAVLKDHIGGTLKKFKSTYGIYAVTGNHEYFSGADAACKYLTEHGVVMLRDSLAKIINSFYIAGREDRQRNSSALGKRKELSDILNGADNSLPIILMDHQPFKLEEAVQNKVDLQLSGHTHNGQLWPLNYITNMVYEVGWGYKQKENTHFYVSCGAGTWGPPVRTGSRPEIVNVILRFK
jgi:predicted MPP superfamily phosphohydrolase